MDVFAPVAQINIPQDLWQIIFAIPQDYRAPFLEQITQHKSVFASMSNCQRVCKTWYQSLHQQHQEVLKSFYSLLSGQNIPREISQEPHQLLRLLLDMPALHDLKRIPNDPHSVYSSQRFTSLCGYFSLTGAQERNLPFSPERLSFMMRNYFDHDALTRLRERIETISQNIKKNIPSNAFPQDPHIDYLFDRMDQLIPADSTQFFKTAEANPALQVCCLVAYQISCFRRKANKLDTCGTPLKILWPIVKKQLFSRLVFIKIFVNLEAKHRYFDNKIDGLIRHLTDKYKKIGFPKTLELTIHPEPEDSQLLETLLALVLKKINPVHSWDPESSTRFPFIKDLRDKPESICWTPYYDDVHRNIQTLFRLQPEIEFLDFLTKFQETHQQTLERFSGAHAKKPNLLTIHTSSRGISVPQSQQIFQKLLRVFPLVIPLSKSSRAVSKLQYLVDIADGIKGRPDAHYKAILEPILRKIQKNTVYQVGSPWTIKIEIFHFRIHDRIAKSIDKSIRLNYDRNHAKAKLYRYYLYSGRKDFK